MRHLSFILGLIFRRQERVHGETDFLGFEAFTRPTETNDAAATSPADKAAKTASAADKQLLRAA